MTPYYESNGVTIYHGDCREILPLLELVHAIICDPPYELGFMGKAWDKSGIAYDVKMWQECLRVLKPGGHLLSFGGSRTYHRMACAIEDAGFEIRDQIMWLYGCLDEQTELVSESGVKPYHKAKIGERVLCYNPENGEYSYQPIMEIVEYDYSDTAYRLIGDFGEQVVSRNHRCIVERGGSEVFQFAETIRSEARVPVLEGLSELRQALSNLQSDSGGSEQIVQPRVHQYTDWEREQRFDFAKEEEGQDSSLCGVWEREMGSLGVVEENQANSVQLRVQWSSERHSVETTRIQGEETLETGIGGCVEDSHDGSDQSSMEGGSDLSEAQGSVCRPANKVCSLPIRVPEHGAEGWLCDGTSSPGRSGNWQTSPESRSCSSQESQSEGESTNQPNAVCDERGTQGIRAWRGHKTSLVRVVPFQYTGKMWCLRVSTGAFVAVRGGAAFPTGNSGFPKSLDVSKAIDKAAGATRPVVGVNTNGSGPNLTKLDNHEAGDTGIGYMDGSGKVFDVTAPATVEARQWQGWGTALKPAHEPICVARKPVEGTVAANVLKNGTGALNIDGCRIDATDDLVEDDGRRVDMARESIAEGYDRPNATMFRTGKPAVRGGPSNQLGRWPANVIHDGSDEVLSCFPESKGQQGDVRGDEPSGVTDEIYGKFNGRVSSPARLDSSSAARFFYTAKADKEERERNCCELTPPKRDGSRKDGNPGGDNPRNRGVHERINNHPTVKPLDLMRYLCKLLCPPSGGILLDPFMGSGSTLIAGRGFYQRCIGIELEERYCEIAAKRLSQQVLGFE